MAIQSLYSQAAVWRDNRFDSFKWTLAPIVPTSATAPEYLGPSIVATVRSYADPLDAPLRASRKRSRPWRLLAFSLTPPELRRLEGVLSVGNALFQMIRRVEKNWRDEVLTGKTLFDPNEEKQIVGYFKEWLAPTERCLGEIKVISRRHPAVEGADEFQKNCVEAKNVVIERSSFFDDAENAKRWERATAFIRPKAESIRVDEQGRIFDSAGKQIIAPGLEPAKVRDARSKIQGGRRRTYGELAASQAPDGI